ncbi:leucine-rich repeat extensin-like protein 4 [Juglans microcarpa x Juglans regia]|uniref:leucine-rich repeat extensin-like protein 4 n=1 Tax=Juglans microcarpa x Juglans regia TaxID=2249226 RepID=UPI001B7DE0A3|nr:leucine-rich repeat extensin-like protein 4 [Juglans microcarpa x Juglans regia]
MEKCWLLAVLLLRISSTVAAFSVGGGIGVDVGIGNAGGGGGGGGGGVWIGGGINNPVPSGSGSSVPSLNGAYTALQAWKSAIKDDPLRILDTWVGSDVCSYKGVFCAEPQDEMDASPGRVVAGIDLNHANLQGTLVKELSLLTDISLFHLNSNRFSGTLPDTFRDLFSLQELDLSNNLFSGPFPVVTLYIPNLIYLDLRFNEFSGSIPDDLFNKKLDAIFLNNNQFEGQLPQNLANSPASVINLANNKFSGNIPISFGFMGSNLKEILFLNNRLTGCIPEGVGLFTEMQVLDVSSNSLMGHLPDTISCLENMEVLNLAHNELSGVVPDPVCSLKRLVNLTVAYNFFSGFSQQCNKLFFRNVGFDFSVNCVPGKNMQRPQPECSLIPGGGLNCLRIPLVCGSIGVMAAAETRPSSSSSSSSSP